MLLPLRALVALAALAAATCAQTPAGDDLLAALRRWRAAYARDEFDLTDVRSRYLRIPRTIVVDPDDPGSELDQIRLLARNAAGSGSPDVLAELLDLVRPTTEHGEWAWDRPVLDEVVRDSFRGAGPAVVRELLAIAQHHRTATVRAEALRAVAVCLGPVPAPDVVPSLSDAEPSVRTAAAVALHDAVPPDVATLAMVLRTEPEPDVLHAAAIALTTVLSVTPADGTTAHYLITTGVRAALARVLATDPDAARPLFGLLQRLGSRDAVAALIDSLDHLATLPTRTPVEVRKATDLARAVHQTLRATTGRSLEGAAAWRSWFEAVDAAVWRTLATTDTSTVSAPRPRSSFFGMPVSGRHIVFVLDTSGSMRGTALRRSAQRWVPPTRLDVAQRELETAISSLDAEALFGVVTFAARANPLASHLIRATDEHKRMAFALANAYRGGGSTSLRPALEIALDLGPEGQSGPGAPDEILLVSDCRLADRDANLADIVATAVRRGTRISVVAVGPAAPLALVSLARQTGGRLTLFRTR